MNLFPGRLLLLAATLPFLACASDPLLVDAEPTAGFALYRTGRLTEAELAALCEEGVEEILVLSGTADRRECVLREVACPELRVRYDREQRADVPLSETFLAAFDRWVEEAREAGRKIAFRCYHGWHRTGRLVAYYRMRHQGRPAAEAIREMHEVGRFMWLWPELDREVEELGEELRSGASPGAEVVEGTEDAMFPPDVCGGGG